jgi:predicted transglutaminase-like cysteine proteinase
MPVRTILGWAALLVCLDLAAGARAAPDPVFGSTDTPLSADVPLPQWQGLLERLAAEAPAYDACRSGRPCPSEAARLWLQLLQELGSAPLAMQLREVNNFINGWPYRPDPEAYGERDHWATPLEFLEHSGDCEDYAAIKYVSLRRLGFRPDRLRLVVVRDTARKIAHAVLLARLDQGWQVLDNLSDRILPPDRIDHYRPYYSVNEEMRWSHLQPARPGDASSPSGADERD